MVENPEKKLLKKIDILFQICERQLNQKNLWESH